MKNEQTRKGFESLSYMYDNKADNYNYKADKYHEEGNYEDEKYYRDLAKEAELDAQICRDFRDMY